MMKRRGRIAVATVLLVACTAGMAQAQPKEKRFMATGIGAAENSCAVWLTARKHKEKSDEQYGRYFAMMSWFQGNLAGRNALTQPPIAIPPSSKLEQIIDTYCDTDATNNLHEIAESFWPIVVELDRKREATRK